MRIGVELHEYCDSLSCLHALEHFGLGRYGDPVDVLGHERGLLNLHAVLEPEGILYLSVPIGEDRVDFNAMRVLGISTVLRLIEGRFSLLSFSFVDDVGDLHESASLTPRAIQENCGCYYGCGIFEFRKLGQS